MPVIQSPPQPSANTLPRIARWVEVKQTWGGSWAPLPFWVPANATIDVAPGHGSASFARWLGVVQPEGSTVKQTFTPTDLTDWYCRFMICYPGQQPVAVWTGVVSDISVLVDSPVVGRTITADAFGLTWLLDRQPITQSWAKNGSSPPVLIDRLPAFNLRDSGRGLSLAGNRSQEKDGTLGCYVFQGGDDGGDIWTNRDIAEYLLATQSPAAVQFELAGLTDALGEMKSEWAQQGTAWAMLCRLIDHRHGMAFFPKVLDSGKVQLWITSEVETAINYGGATLPANPVQTYFTLPTTGVDAHLPLDVRCRFTAIQRFDEIIIRGQRVVVMFTISVEDGTLDKGWTSSLASSYRSAGALSDPHAADEFRAQSRYEDVFSRFVIPRDWDGSVQDGEGGGQSRFVTPTPNDDGTLDFTQAGEFWRDFKLLDRQLPIEKGKSYESDPITDDNPDGEEPEFRPILVAISDSFDGANHKATTKMIRLDRLGSGQSGLHNLSATTLDKDLGIRINCHPQHYLAGTDWTPATDATEVLPELNWVGLLATVSMTTDVRPNIRIQFGSGGENEKVKVIDVDGAEFWYAVEDTVVDVDADGSLVRIDSANLAIRDDVDKLQSRAAFARRWYEVQRQAVTIPIQMLGQFVELGTYLIGISNVYTWLSVGTIVTSIAWDFPAGTTTISTGRGGDDVMIEPVEFVGKRRSSRAGK